MTLPDFASAAADVAALRPFLPIRSPEAPMPADNDHLNTMRDRIHQHIGCVMRVREGIADGDGSQTFATAMTTLKAAQGEADDLVAELDRVRVEIMRAFPAEAAARMGRPIPVLLAQSAGA